MTYENFFETEKIEQNFLLKHIAFGHVGKKTEVSQIMKPKCTGGHTTAQLFKKKKTSTESIF